MFKITALLYAQKYTMRNLILYESANLLAAKYEITFQIISVHTCIQII